MASDCLPCPPLRLFLFRRFVQDAGSPGYPSASTLAVETTVLTDSKYVHEDGSMSSVRASNAHGLNNFDMQEHDCVDFMRAVGLRTSPSEWGLTWQALVHGGVPFPSGPWHCTIVCEGTWSRLCPGRTLATHCGFASWGGLVFTEMRGRFKRSFNSLDELRMSFVPDLQGRSF